MDDLAFFRALDVLVRKVRRGESNAFDKEKLVADVLKAHAEYPSEQLEAMWDYKTYVMEAVEACGAEEAFLPREELYGREGSSMKWVQQVSGYFFAQSRLQRVRFASQPRVRLLFYFDPSEPINSEEPGRIVNPEVVNCVFL